MDPGDTFVAPPTPLQESTPGETLVVAEMFAIFEEIRDLLHKGDAANGGPKGQPALAQAFPITEHADRTLPVGFCKKSVVDGQVPQWRTITPSRKELANEQVDRVSLRVRDLRGNLYAVTNMIGTLLHEFAHVIEPTARVRTAEPRRSGRGGPGEFTSHRDWAIANHDDRFYEIFRDVLKDAEKLQIFTMGALTAKFELRSLRRFDEHDTETPLPATFSPRYAARMQEVLLRAAEADARQAGDGALERLKSARASSWQECAVSIAAQPPKGRKPTCKVVKLVPKDLSSDAELFKRLSKAFGFRVQRLVVRNSGLLLDSPAEHLLAARAALPESLGTASISEDLLALPKGRSG